MLHKGFACNSHDSQASVINPIWGLILQDVTHLDGLPSDSRLIMGESWEEVGGALENFTGLIMDDCDFKDIIGTWK